MDRLTRLRTERAALLASVPDLHKFSEQTARLIEWDRTHGAELAKLETHAELRRALRAYDLAGPLTENRRQALGEVLTLARQLTVKTYTAPENYTATELVDLIREAYTHADTTGEAVQVRAAGRVQYTHDPKAKHRTLAQQVEDAASMARDYPTRRGM